MARFDNFINELCASIEAKDKINNIHSDKEQIKIIRSKLESILGNFVDTNIQNVRAAYSGIEDYFFLPEYERNNDLLTILESSLTNCIGLNPDLYTQGIKNSDLLAYVYYGIFFINLVKRNRLMAERYLWKLFAVNPRIARNDLAPAVYDEYFKPQFIDYYNTQMQFLPRDPRRNFKVSDKEPILMLERFEKNIVIHNEEFDKNLDKQCIEIAKKALGDFDIW